MRLAFTIAAALCALPSMGFAQSPDQARGWKAEMAKIVAAAEAEGQLVMMSQPNQAFRNYIQTEFPKAYPKISLSVSALEPPQYIGRVKTERQAGKYLWDLAVAGYVPAYVLSHDGALDPILDEFVDPEIKNPALWGGWEEALTDKAHKYVFAMSNYIAGPWVDALHVPMAKVEKLGLRVMLEPELKGKVVWHDPTLLGSGQGYAYLLYDKLGKDGLRTLIVDQKAQLVPKMFEVVEYMARGTAWVGIGPPVRALIKRYEKAGLKADVRAMGNGADRNANVMGGSFLSVFNKRPHPNAARVFVNWLLTKDVQHGLATALDQASRRKDVPTTTLPDETPIAGAHYFAPQREENLPKIREAAAYIAELKKEVK